MQPQPLVIVFAKCPVPGRVKTRLLPHCTPAQAARLHRAMVEDLLGRLSGRFLVKLLTDTDCDAWPRPEVSKGLQISGDLGQRMFAALQQGLQEGFSPVMILGSDAPGVPLPYLDELLANPADVTLGPCEDGGYYAISCRRIAAEMFTGVQWSTCVTRLQTLAACTLAGLSVALGDPWWDVDTGEDVNRLERQPDLGPAVRAWFAAEKGKSRP